MLTFLISGINLSHVAFWHLTLQLETIPKSLIAIGDNSQIPYEQLNLAHQKSANRKNPHICGQ